MPPHGMELFSAIKGTSFTRRQMRARLAVIVTILSGFAPALAVEPLKSELVCPAPVSICQNRTDGEASCPAGYRCTCVPSCPTCTDCAAQVCLPELNKQCRTACDCSPGLTCQDGHCVAGFAPTFCCESDRCPVGQACQHADGRADRCGQQCQSACDCEAGLACVDGQCISGFAPVYCCEGEQCPAGQQCQHRDGRRDRCGAGCTAQVWRCDTPGAACGDDRVCACAASCPTCEDCGAGVCVPHGSATPYACDAGGHCAQPGDRCLCVASCPDCDDCARRVCVPGCDPMCDRRQRISSKRIDRVVDLTRQCRGDADCVPIDTSSGCRATCGAWINRRYAERVNKLIEYLDQRYCGTFQADGCPLTAPTCPAQHGVCTDGSCSGAPSTPAQ